MPITFDEVARLEGLFVRRGREIRAQSSEPQLQLLREALAELESRVDSNEVALLSRYILGNHSGLIVELALGALDLVRQEVRADPERARFALKFGLQRLRALTGRAPSWRVPELDTHERDEMEALLGAALGDRSFTDQELIDRAREFAAEHELSGHHFRRLSSGLRLLIDVLEKSDSDVGHREMARAALTYFREVSDAIPDDLGPVGMLDDAVVIQRAIAEINPERGAIGFLLDDVVREWPFIMDLSFGSEVDGHPLSEFLLVSAALLLDPVLENDTRGAALALSRPGPLPFLVAVLRALAEVKDALDEALVPTFRRGDHLVSPAGSGVVEFVRYVRCRDDSRIFEDAKNCGPEEATHFEILQVGPEKPIRRFRRVQDIRGFRRSKGVRGDLRAGRVEFDLSRQPIGALERVFGLTAPAVLRPERHRILFVGPAGETRRLASELTILDTPIVDLLPISRERLDGESFVTERWTTLRGSGGDPVLSIVPSTAEALELAESDETVAAVVALVTPGSNDAANLCRIASGGRRVLAIPGEQDGDALRQFSRAGFGFWVWSDEWLDGLDWPRSGRSGTTAVVQDFERELRRRAGSRTESVILEMPGLERAFAAAHELESIARRENLGALAEVASDCIGALVRICRFLAPPGRQSWESLRGLWAGLQVAVRERRQWWPNDWLERFESVFAGANEAVESLQWNAPKFEATMSWSYSNPHGLLAAPASDRDFLDELATPPDLRWLDRPYPDDPETPILVPAWYGKQRMDRLLHPPVARSMKLLLYRPEVAWFEGSKAKAARVAAEMRDLIQRHRPFRAMRRYSPRIPEAVDSSTIALPDPDEIALRGRRVRAMQKLGSTTDRTVEARLVYFAGGGWAAFAPAHRVLQLLSIAKVGEEIAEQLTQRRASEVGAGDLLLLVRGSDRDAIRDAVDAIAPARLRGQAAAWRGALERALRSGRSYEEIQIALGREGCRRTLFTLRGWIEDDEVIGPRGGDQDVDAILRVTGDRGLRAELDDCKRAIEKLWRLHQQCGNRLTREVVARVRNRLRDGSVIDDVVEIENRVVLVVIESVDPDLVTVPLGMANRLQEGS